MSELPDDLALRLQAALGEGYQVEKPLGEGGFAVVYLVLDRNLKRRLAVKVLSPDLITSKTVLERFRREAETVAQLSHPHIVPLHFIGQKDDLLYLVMECIDGGSLADRIKSEGRLPPGDVSRILREVASALEYAHKRGVIHRDIKPHNILIEKETGRTLVTDFGIARTAEGGSLTATGMLVGTPAYLSPELVAGEGGDHRSDIYALGIVAYEMLTGQPPFTGPTPTAVLMKRLGEPPPPLVKVRPEAPERLRDVIEGMLASDPAQRFQSAGDVVRALDGQPASSGGFATMELALKEKRRRRKRMGIAALVAALAAALAATSVLLFRSKTPVVIASVDPDMVVIQGGDYTIGTNAGSTLARPEHKVHVDPFGIDTREVTVGDFAGYVANGKAVAPWTTEPDSLLPVTGVSYSDAMNFCAWRHSPGGRLPKEEEWEAAARGLSGRSFPWGNAWDPSAANTQSAHRSGPARVGSFSRGMTPDSVHDLVGNVWEWTMTPLAPYPGGPPVPGLKSNQYYVIRGGAFNTPDSTASTTLRGYADASADKITLDKTGFRCVMPVRAPDSR
jgi:formylglycine-generating enzyme required for sulfatase activity/tRNA A-37 threonylcarbamoyl transferase component Bud32